MKNFSLAAIIILSGYVAEKYKPVLICDKTCVYVVKAP
jgi:hypothetical protein